MKTCNKWRISLFSLVKIHTFLQLYENIGRSMLSSWVSCGAYEHSFKKMKCNPLQRLL